MVVLSILIWTPQAMPQYMGASSSQFVMDAERQFETSRRLRTMDPAGYISQLKNLADIYYNRQSYAKARMYYKEYLLQAAREGLFDYDSEECVNTILHQGMAALYLGDYENCLEVLSGCLGVVSDKPLLQKTEVIACCIMTECYIRQDNMEAAEEGIDIIRQLVALYDMKDSYVLNLCKYEEALLMCCIDLEKADGMLDKIDYDYPMDDHDGAMLAMKCTRLYADYIGNLESTEEFDAASQAVSIYHNMIDLMEKNDVVYHIDYFDTYVDALVCHLNNGEDGTEMSCKISDIARRRIHDNFQEMSESERTVYWDRFNNWFMHFLPILAIVNQSDEYKKLAYDGLLLSKGMLLRSSMSIRNHVLESQNEELIEILDQISYLKKKQYALNRNESEDADQESFNLTTNIMRLEQRLLKGLGEIDFMEDVYIDTEAVRECLSEGDVTMEFLCLPAFDDALNFNDSEEYYAFILKSEYEAPHIMKIGAIDDSWDPMDLNGYAYSGIWSKLEDELRDAKRIFFSADNILHRLPIEYADMPDGEAVNERYEVYRLTSTRELALRKNTESISKGMSAFGNIDYNMSKGADFEKKLFDSACPDELIAMSELPDDRTDQHRGAYEASTGMFPDLAYSKNEIYSLADLAVKTKRSFELFESSDASEEAFKSLSGKTSGILIMSTHGYYDSSGNIPSRMNDEGFVTDGVSVEDLMLRNSGIVLAGANQVFQNDSIYVEQSQDGLLTALELSHMNLENVDFAVLSACETGLGEVSSEGVFGLQRGFKKSGVNSLLMSLWKVNDYATSRFIVKFFESYLEGGSKREALNSAIRYVKSMDNGFWNKPEYWGGFILLDAI